MLKDKIICNFGKLKTIQRTMYTFLMSGRFRPRITYSMNTDENLNQGNEMHSKIVY